MRSYESINYCPECHKYFDDPDELEVHKNVKHGGKQNTLFEQLTPQYLDQQNIMIEDQNFSLPPPRKHADNNEAKANWEGMWEEERLRVLKDGMLDPEYAEYSFSELPEDVRNKIYFTLQKYATTRERNEQNITDDGTDKEEVKGQFNAFADELIPADCPRCKQSFPDVVPLVLHLTRNYNMGDDEAFAIAKKEMKKWKEERISKIQQGTSDNIMKSKGWISGIFEAKEYIMSWNGLEDLANSLTSDRLDTMNYKELKNLLIQVEKNIELVRDSLNEPEHYGVQNDNSKARLILSQLELGIAEIEGKLFDAKSRDDKRSSFSPFDDYMSNPDYTIESMLKSETLSPYEISNRNGDIISQHVDTEEEVQEIINKYQSEYIEKHYGSLDAIIVRDSIGNDVSRMFKNAIQEWETTSIENIDKQLEYTERGLGI